MYLPVLLNDIVIGGEYYSEPVSKEDLRKILEAGLAAPSGCNKQTTSLIAVDDEKLVEQIKAVIDPPIAQTVIEALMEVVGESGTIMMPTQSWKNLDPGDGVHWDADEADCSLFAITGLLMIKI